MLNVAGEHSKWIWLYLKEKNICGSESMVSFRSLEDNGDLCGKKGPLERWWYQLVFLPTLCEFWHFVFSIILQLVCIAVLEVLLSESKISSYKEIKLIEGTVWIPKQKILGKNERTTQKAYETLKYLCVMKFEKEHVSKWDYPGGNPCSKYAELPLILLAEIIYFCSWNLCQRLISSF